MDNNVEILRRYNRWRRGQALWNAAADFPNPRVVDEAIDAACDEIERLRAELETERMRLAACSVIALANTPESAASARGMHPDYQSPSCDDVARAVDREIALRAELEECRRDAERYRTALEQIVAPFEDLNFVSGNKPLTYIHDVTTNALAAKETK